MISKLKPLLFIVAIAVFTIACKEAESTKDSIPSAQEPTEQPQATQNQAPTSTQTTTPANATGEVTLNPPHGQPGHDCAIPVGQPLSNSSNGTPTNNANINPPHGQPGHRCDIAVGAPLN